jgi:hypothetical protein
MDQLWPGPNAATTPCPLGGNRSGDATFRAAVDSRKRQAPFIWSVQSQIVEMRGGEYFFLPSLTALRMIGMGNSRSDLTRPVRLLGLGFCDLVFSVTTFSVLGAGLTTTRLYTTTSGAGFRLRR